MTHPGPPGELVAVCVLYQIIGIPGRDVRSGIDKRPVPHAVRVGALGLAGDRQLDRVHHGGAAQAVYAYAEEEAARWADELGRPIPPGLFGENLRVAGVATTDAVIGERWRIGTAELEITKPRTPCFKFAHVMGQPRWVKRFTDRGDVGAYLRVVTEGVIRAGDGIHVTHRPAGAPTVRDVFRTATRSG